MHRERESTLAELKEQISQDSYRVDARAVADAIVRHIRGLALATAERAVPAESLVNRDRQ